MDISHVIGLLLLVGAVLIPALLAVIAFFTLGRIFYKVPGPDEALVITGRGAKPTREFQEQLATERAAADKVAEQLAAEQDDDDIATKTAAAAKVEPDPEFKVVVGTGSWLKPGQRMERLSLAAQQAPVELKDVPTFQGINLHTSATVLYKVGDSYSAIARAARRFAGNNDWTDMVKDVLEGKLREVIGTMTVEEIWRDRQTLAIRVEEASTEELGRLGLQIESFQLKPIEDPSGYIANLAAGPLAIAERDAKILRAENTQQAAQREAEMNTATVNAETQAKIEQAQARQEADRIEAEANQAKPLAEAKARQAVIEEETKNTELEKELNLQKLKATVYQEADAAKYAAVVNAQAQSETAIIQAEAQAKATQVAADARKDAADSNAEADAVAVERAATAAATASTAAAESEAASIKLRADALKEQGLAEAAADEARGLAVAKVTREQGLARAEALTKEAEAQSANKDVLVELELVKQLPNVMAANAQAFARVNSITVNDGVEGLQNGIAGVLQQGLASLPAVLQVLKGTSLGAVATSFPTFDTPDDDDTDPDNGGGGSTPAPTDGGPKGGAALSKLASSLDKSASSGLADVSSSFSKKAVDVDLSSAGGLSVTDALSNVQGGLVQAQGAIDTATNVAGQVESFAEENQEQINQLAAAAGRVRRRTR